MGDQNQLLVLGLSRGADVMTIRSEQLMQAFKTLVEAPLALVA